MCTLEDITGGGRDCVGRVRMLEAGYRYGRLRHFDGATGEAARGYVIRGSVPDGLNQR